jgi:hypothetical protein
MRREWPPLPKVVKGSVCDYKVTIGTQDQSNAGERVISEKGAELRVTGVLPPEMRQQTFIHEWLHKIEQEMSFKLKESQIDRLATGIFQDIKRNNWKLPWE